MKIWRRGPRVAARRAAMIALACVLAVVGLSAPARADSAYGTVGDLGTHAGNRYWNQAEAISSEYDSGFTGTWVSTGHAYMGSQGRLFTSGGALCSDSGMQYTYANAYWVGTSRGGCSAGYYYSSGFSAAWNGNGYTTYTTFRSPNIYMS